ncbi:MAG TPA: hypothetical protein DDW31_09110 [candidate division Zixibacteria bacterium]|nr:hypothetical protein [candidate division Zixibacteria bacterium]
MDKLKAAVGLTRPGNLAVVGLSVLVGSSGMWPAGGFWRVALAALSAVLVAGGGNALNDYFDLKADLINRPGRPLPAGRIGPGAAAGMAVILLSAGAAAGWLISAANGLVAAAVAVTLCAYAVWGKRLSVAGNLMVAAACGAAFVYGGLAAGAVMMSFFPAAFALLMHLAREMIKDVQDREGDQAAGAVTTAVALGDRKSLALAAGVLGLLVLLTPVPFLLGAYGWRYLAAVVLGVDLMLVFIIYWLVRDPDRERIKNISFYLKIDMLVGMMAVCLGLSG